MSRVALITGSTSGIGLAIASKLSQSGMHIVINGFGDDALIDSIKQRIQANGVQCLYHGADLTDTDQMDELIHTINRTFGRLDVLVNNAGIQYTAPIEEFGYSSWQRMIDLMLTAPFYLTAQTIELMRRNNWGRIINMASVHGLVGSKNKAAYVCAKHGLVGLTKVTALENAGSGITANAICPGWVNTPLIQPQIDLRASEKGIGREEAIRDVVGEKQPSMQFVEPEQIADLAAFLCSDAASQITGASLPIDGGWTAQ